MAKRLDGLDAVKIIAAFVIVLEHSVLRGTQGNQVAYFIFGACHVAVPTFFAVAGYIAGLKPATGSLADYARRRAKRLLVPAVFWIAFYQLFIYSRTGATPWGDSVGSWLLVNFGGGGYAWFLVVLFLVSVLANWLDRSVTSMWPAYLGMTLFVILGLVQPLGPVALGRGTFNVFILAYGATYWAALRLARTEWRPPLAVSLTALGTLVLASGVFQVMRQTTGSQSLSWLMYAASSVAAFAAVAVAVDARPSWGWVLRPFGWAREATLGIYIVHLAFIGYVHMAMPEVGGPLFRTLLTAVVTFLVTAAGVSLARKWKVARAVL